MRVLGIVPARGGSKRLPGKNLMVLGGRPLVRWALDAALGATRLDRVVLSSDDAAILAEAAPLPAVRALRRPDELAGDTAPAIDYVRHALAVLEGEGEARYDAVAIVQPSSPLTRPADIDAVVDLLATSGADSAVSVVRLDHAVHPIKLKLLDGDRLRPYWEEERGRRAAHELPALYVRNCAVYAARRAVCDAGEIIGPDCRGLVMPRERSIDINEDIDLAFAEFLLARAGGGVLTCIYYDLEEVSAAEVARARARAGAGALELLPDGALWPAGLAGPPPARVRDRRDPSFQDQVMAWLEGLSAALAGVGLDARAWQRRGAPLFEVVLYDLMRAITPELQRWHAVGEAHRLGAGRLLWVARPLRLHERRELVALARGAPAPTVELELLAVPARRLVRGVAGSANAVVYPHLERLGLLARALGRRAASPPAPGRPLAAFTEFFPNGTRASAPVAQALVAEHGFDVRWVAGRRMVRDELARHGQTATLLEELAPAAAHARGWIGLGERRALAQALARVPAASLAWPDFAAGGADYLRRLARRRLTAAVDAAVRWIEAYAAAWATLRPDVVVTTTYSSMQGRAAAATARALGVPSVFVQHGIHSDRLVHCRLTHDLLLMWGEFDRRSLLQHGIPAASIEVVGSTLYDGFLARARAAPPRPLSPAIGLRVAFMASRSAGMVASAAIARATLRGVAEAVRALPGAELTIKVHPADGTTVPEEVAREYPGVRLVRDGSSQDIILASDVVVVVSSSTGAESCLANRPLVVFNATGFAEVGEYVTCGAALAVSSADELAAVLRAIAGDEGLRARLAAGRRRYIDETLAGGRGDAGARAARLVAERVGAGARGGAAERRREGQRA